MKITRTVITVNDAVRKSGVQGRYAPTPVGLSGPAMESPGRISFRFPFIFAKNAVKTLMAPAIVTGITCTPYSHRSLSPSLLIRCLSYLPSLGSMPVQSVPALSYSSANIGRSRFHTVQLDQALQGPVQRLG